MFRQTFLRFVIPLMVMALACNFSTGSTPTSSVTTSSPVPITKAVETRLPNSFGAV